MTVLQNHVIIRMIRMISYGIKLQSLKIQKTTAHSSLNIHALYSISVNSQYKLPQFIQFVLSYLSTGSCMLGLATNHKLQLSQMSFFLNFFSCQLGSPVPVTVRFSGAGSSDDPLYAPC